MTSATPFAKPADQRPPAPETDSIPRIEILDLMTAVRHLHRAAAPTLEDMRLKLNLRREKFGSTTGYSIARDVAAELGKLGYAKAGPLPKDRLAFEKKRDTSIRLTETGQELASLLATKNVGGAYEALLHRLYDTHLYFRRFIAAVAHGPFLTPVITGAERHIAPRYAEARILADDVARGSFDSAALISRVEERLNRPLSEEERREIDRGLVDLVQTAAVAASAREDVFSDFQRKFLSRLNEVVVPAVLRATGLGFDFNTLRRLWAMAQEFQIAWATSTHPQHDCWVTFATAKIELSPDESRLLSVSFDKGITAIDVDFLDRLYEAYETMQGWGCGAYVKAWQLRATFCLAQGCAPGVFNHMFKENYAGSDKYEIHKDFSHDRPQHEHPVVAGNREIGIVRMLKR